ncbi:MAG TPA: Ig-like domain-containing protein, partial [Pirellulaceae bacterium]|nr:Ig-like domain-containing protein [Pirellulaceae bacterium]
ADGSYTYTVDDSDPAVQALRTSGQTLTDSFTYEMSDAAGATSTATLTITITGANDTPVGSDDAFVIDEDSAGLVGQLIASDVDAGDSLAFSIVRQPASGSLTVSPDGEFTFIPGAAFRDLAVGQTRTVDFRFAVTDAAGATDEREVTIVVEGRNDGPTATDDVATTGESSAIDVDVLANDSDPDSTDTTRVVSAGLVAGLGTVSFDDGRVSFVPDSTYEGLAEGESAVVTISYEIEDPYGARSTALLTITVTGERDRLAVDVADTVVAEDNAASIPILVTRIDQNGESLQSLRLTGLPSGTRLFDADGHQLVSTGLGMVVDVAGWDLATLGLLPPTDFSGTIALQVEIESDAAVDPLQTASITIDVLAVADRPILGTAPAIGFEGTVIPLQISTGAVDVGGSERLELVVRHLPVGAQLTDGTRTITAVTGNETFDLSTWNLSRLSFFGRDLAATDVRLEFELTSVEAGNGSRASVTSTLRIELLPAPQIHLDTPPSDHGPADASDPAGDSTDLSRAPEARMTAGSSVARSASSPNPIAAPVVEAGFAPDGRVVRGEEVADNEFEQPSGSLRDDSTDDSEAAAWERLGTEIRAVRLEAVQAVEPTSALLDLSAGADFRRLARSSETVETEVAAPDDSELIESRSADESTESTSTWTTRFGILWGLVRSLGTPRERSDLQEERQRRQR